MTVIKTTVPGAGNKRVSGTHLLACLLVFFPRAGLDAQTDLNSQIRAAQASGQYAKAADLYQQLIASGVDTPEIRTNWGIMLHLSGKHRESLDQFRRALRLNPNLPPANLFAGMAEVELHEYQAALPFLKKAANLNQRDTAPLLALAKAYLGLRDYRAAHDSYAGVASLDPNLAEAWYGAGVTNRAQADLVLNRAARSGKANDPAVQAEARRLLDDALSALDRAMTLDPKSPRTHLIKAEALSDAGRFSEAIGEYQATLEIDPNETAARVGLATGYWREHLFADALPLLRQVLEQSPKDPEANGMLADILAHDGKWDAARERAELALAGNPDLIQTHVVLARVWLGKKRPAQAIAELLKVAAADPDGSYHFLLFRAYREAGDEKNADVALAEFRRLHGFTTQP